MGPEGKLGELIARITQDVHAIGEFLDQGVNVTFHDSFLAH